MRRFDLPSTEGGKERSDEWYTQEQYIEAARLVLGGRIDLDPASSHQANLVVKATSYFTKEQNGLAQDWRGHVWLNPPFGRANPAIRGFGGGKSIMGQFTHKLVEEYEAGHVTAAIALVTSKTDARWFQGLARYPLCFANHRVLFHRPGRSKEGHFYGTVFAYLGPNPRLFFHVFSQFGNVYQRVTPPRLVLTPETMDRQYSDDYDLQASMSGVNRHRLMYGDWLDAEDHPTRDMRTLCAELEARANARAKKYMEGKDNEGR